MKKSKNEFEFKKPPTFKEFLDPENGYLPKDITDKFKHKNYMGLLKKLFKEIGDKYV